MAGITITLSDQQLEQLQTLAAQAGLEPEQLLERHVESILRGFDSEFQRAANRVLDKNAELYRRLA